MTTSARQYGIAITATLVLIVVAIGAGVWIGRQGPSASQPASSAALSRPMSVERDQLAPLFSLPTVTQQQIDLAALDGDVVLINFWATWCPPCRDEMPVIQAAHERYGPQGFRVLAVNVQETAPQVEAFGRELGLTFPLLLDQSGAVTRTYRVQNLPRNFFLARDGRVVRIHPGELTTETVERYLKELL